MLYQGLHCIGIHFRVHVVPVFGMGLKLLWCVGVRLEFLACSGM